jgi:hypothetical protein
VALFYSDNAGAQLDSIRDTDQTAYQLLRDLFDKIDRGAKLGQRVATRRGPDGRTMYLIAESGWVVVVTGADRLGRIDVVDVIPEPTE